MLQVGIVGLPNVGKSTLFNALLRKQQALAANYPFATIEPNVGVVPVPDARLDKLAEIVMAEEKLPTRPPLVPATIRFVDIAGLVKGASEGAGLGNKFLSHIREVDLICEVVRGFPDSDVIREGSTDPKNDIGTINTELILADLQTLSNQTTKLRAPATPGKFKSAVEKLTSELNQGKLASEVMLDDEEREEVKQLQLLSAKRIVYVLNVNTTTDWKQTEEVVKNLAGNVCVIDAKLEADLSVLSPDEQAEYLQSLGITDSGVEQFIALAYRSLGLISFLTAGEKEIRAWTVEKGAKAPQAAGVIHTDFEKAFIKAEVISFADYVSFNGIKPAREAGRVRFEGKEYEVKDGDVIEFKVNA